MALFHQNLISDAERILENITEAFFALDREWSFTYLNEEAERLLVRTRNDLTGRAIWNEFPDMVESTFEREFRRAVTQQIVVSFEAFYAPLLAWFDVRADPSHDGLSVYFTDITDRVRTEQSLRESEERLRLATEGAGIGIWRYVPETKEVTCTKRCYEIFGLPTDGGAMFTYELIASLIHPDDLPHVTAALEKSALDHTDFECEYRVITPSGPIRWVQLRGKPYCDLLGVVQHMEGVTIDITPQREISERLMAAHAVALNEAEERQALEVERARLMVQMQARAEREELINHVGQALLANMPPAAIQESVAILLGKMFGADRCYLSFWDVSKDRIIVPEDYRRADLASVAGKYRASDFSLVMDTLFASGTAVITDARCSGYPSAVVAVMEDFALCSVLAVPFFDPEGRISVALWVAMADAPRTWTPEEVSLAETVALLTRTSVERERLALRERNIATRLQAALMPAIPYRVPGLALTKYYEAALDEARVGGDFYDVFTVEAGCTALVVGDLSGKGLEAAAQVATVRNMLRAFLYSKPNLAEAVTDLNRVLIRHGLITGFATLWVGCYNASNAELTYVNLGQEAALIRRAEGDVTHLPPTGPVLGSFEEAVFEERVVPLGLGDALVVFTDGATECGLTRLEMLGVEGVAALLAPVFTLDERENTDLMAEAVALRLVEGVEAASLGGVTKDDVCILVAVAEGL